MPKILTVDDSRSIRTVIVKQMRDLGFEVGEAEDGEKGLERLEEETFDLVLLDVTMPVLDGPAMLARMRAAGNKTPVIMLTSESKRTVVAEAMKLGIASYILKPFKSDELRAKVLKVLKVAAPISATLAGVEPTLGAAPAQQSVDPNAGMVIGGPVAKQFVDVLVVDDMENVQKRLRALLPEHITLNGCVSAQSALNSCRDRVYRIVLVDTVIPDVNSVSLMRQLRLMQPHASFLALSLRSNGADAGKDVATEGFDGMLVKPFDADTISEFVSTHFGNQDLLAVEDNVLRPAAFTGREDRLDRYMQRLRTCIETGLEQVASACYEEVVIDLQHLPLRRDRTPKLLADLSHLTTKMGLILRLVGPPEVRQLLAALSDTSSIPLFGSVAEALRGEEASHAGVASP